MEFVVVRHPDIEGTAEVSRMAFDATYQEKGWVIVDGEPPAQPAEQPGGEAVPQPDDPGVQQPAEQPADQAPQSDTPIADGLTAQAPTPAPEV